MTSLKIKGGPLGSEAYKVELPTLDMRTRRTFGYHYKKNNGEDAWERGAKQTVDDRLSMSVEAPCALFAVAAVPLAAPLPRCIPPRSPATFTKGHVDRRP